jgi:hypothetical protein
MDQPKLAFGVGRPKNNLSGRAKTAFPAPYQKEPGWGGGPIRQTWDGPIRQTRMGPGPHPTNLRRPHPTNLDEAGPVRQATRGIPPT